MAVTSPAVRQDEGVVDAGSEVDGRTARRDRNRELVLDAVLELFAEHRLFPTAPEVASRSGVSLRSVFRYYEDTEALIQAAMGRNLERLAPLFGVQDVGIGPFEDRVDRFTTARLRLYDAVAPLARASLPRASTNPIIADRLERSRREGRELLEAMFDPELRELTAAKRRIAVAPLDTMFQFEGIEHLRVHLGLSERQIGDVLRQSLRVLLPPH